MRLPPTIRMMAYLGKGLILFGLACAVGVAKLHLRDPRWMGTAIELELAGVGVLFSGMGMYRDWVRDRESGDIDSAGFAPLGENDARDSRAARESSKNEQIDVSRDSNGD